jgi:iron complex outermembrane receptor protein
VRVRGIVTNDFGNGGDPSIGMYKNGLYQGRTGAGVFSLFDIERAEILRGPQGSCSAETPFPGPPNVHTKRPTISQTDSYVELGVGERGIVEFEVQPM